MLVPLGPGYTVCLVFYVLFISLFSNFLFVFCDLVTSGVPNKFDLV